MASSRAFRAGQLLAMGAVLCSVGACASRAEPEVMLPSGDAEGAPGELLGFFVDDYGSRYRISDALWEQLPHGRFHVVEWNVAEQFLVARNDEGNPDEGGLWTRIDWMPLPQAGPDETPYTWGFCMTAYAAATREEARRTPAPDRANPRVGCGGFPFTRMRADPDPDPDSRAHGSAPTTPRAWKGPPDLAPGSPCHHHHLLPARSSRSGGARTVASCSTSTGAPRAPS